MPKYQGVADTLFIPLSARAHVSRRFPEYFYDGKALELERKLPPDALLQYSAEYAMIAAVARYHNLDMMIKNFIQTHQDCNIVNLGCGLDSVYFRIGSASAKFYEIDFPDVIAQRKHLLGETDKEILIGGDMLDMRWADGMDRALPTLMVAAGVFQYLREEKILDFIRKARALFAGAELAFDATNRPGLALANLYVRQTGNSSARMHFHVADGQAFAKKSGTQLIEQRQFFTDTRKMLAGKTRLFTRISMTIADKCGMAMLLHLKLS